MKDRFSTQARQYAAFRPTYPPELYAFILQQVASTDTAWDVGTGNGQVARDLAPSFRTVLATDISSRQLENAFSADNIVYSVAGEESTFPQKSIDLITVAQAIHWFDRPRFYDEVKRVGKGDAILAVWGYSLLRIRPEIDPALNYFYTQVVGPYWDKERKLIDEQYRTISFPFLELPSPEFRFSFQWSLADFRGYLDTWSSVQKYKTATGTDPVSPFIDEIRPLWKEEFQTVNFPLFVRIGKVN